MSDIPGARLALREIARELEKIGMTSMARRIRITVRTQMKRADPISRGETSTRKVTRKVGAEIIDLHRRYPELTQFKIGAELNVAPGSVSKVLNGIYDYED